MSFLKHPAMPSEAKRIKRLKRLSSFVEYGDLNRLKYYLKREKYSKLDLSRAVVNKKNQTLLHVACRFCQPEIVKFLLDNSICDVHASDYKENLPLHLALKSILRIVGKREFVKGTPKVLNYFSCDNNLFSFQHIRTSFSLN